MKNVIFVLIIFLLALTSIKAQTVDEPKLSWSDEFNGVVGIPYPTKWDRPEYNRKQNPSGPDGYWSKEDSFIDGKGNLVVTVRKIANKNGDTDAFDYSSGALRTKGKFQQLYGRYEIRCQLPKQQGWWVAFWMMQGNVGSEANTFIDGAEVDIMGDGDNGLAARAQGGNHLGNARHTGGILTGGRLIEDQHRGIHGDN